MDLHEDSDDAVFSEQKYDDDLNNSHKKNVKRLIDQHLERKRLKDEFKDDFEELNGEFDWGMDER